MRTIPFKQVLWGVAHKFSLDPEQSNFLTNQAIPIGEYIDQWVRRLYDARDWPEWVVTKEIAPVNHVIPWDYADPHNDVRVKFGRILKVFLIDPATTDSPIDTPFTLTDAGIHCGYEHGSFVWIRFIAPPPRFTAAQWDASTTYQLEDVAYSYTSGEVYRSKANNNVGHDPVSNFSLPPDPIIGHPPQLPAPITEVTQELTPSNAGLAERNQITVITFIARGSDTPIPDPPAAGTDFYISVYDNPPNTLLGDSAHTATGSESIATIITAMRAALVAAPGLSTFAITANTTAKTITLENASSFVCAQSSYTFTDGVAHLMRVIDTQTYIPLLAAASGQPQITRTTITPDTTYPGSVYTLHVTDSEGVEHTVDYASQLYDDSAQIIQGIILAKEASSDTFWQGVTLAFDPTGVTMDLGVFDTAGVDLRPAPKGSGYWELVPFPKALADAVMRGAIADLDREWGQDSKADGQEGQVPTESGIAESKVTTMPDPPLVGQQRGNSRYRLQ